MTEPDGARVLLCPCGRSAEVTARPRFPSARPERDGPWIRSLFLCGSCGLTFLDAAAAPLGGGSRFVAPLERVVAALRRRQAAWAARRLPPGARVLDVGAGRGIFVAELARRGFDARGLEPSPEHAARAVAGAKVEVGELEHGWTPNAPLDLVGYWHSLEHTRAPLTSLRAAAAAMKPGALLVVATPNIDSVEARLAGASWLHLDLPYHRFLFTPKTLRALVEEAGFRVERCTSGQWEMDVMGLVEAAATRAGLPRRFLFDALRAGGSGGMPARVLALFLIAAGVLPAAAVCLLCRWLGRAGTLRLLARRAEAPR